MGLTLPGPDPLVRISQLTVAFRGVAALHGIDLHLHRGESLGLVGESGCGKSVTWLAALGLLPRSATVAGSVTLGGTELVNQPQAVLDRVRGGRIAMIFQDPASALNPVHRIGRQVAEAVRLHRGLSGAAARAEALRLLEQVGIPGARARMASYPHEMSGGQNQRVMIAAALAGQPEVLIADEPTTALDVTIQAQILDLLARLRRETGMALVLVSHDLGVVADMCDRVCVMYAGRIVEEAAAAALFAQSGPSVRRRPARRPAAPRRPAPQAARHPRPRAGAVGDAAGLRLRPALRPPRRRLRRGHARPGPGGAAPTAPPASGRLAGRRRVSLLELDRTSAAATPSAAAGSAAAPPCRRWTGPAFRSGAAARSAWSASRAAASPPPGAWRSGWRRRMRASCASPGPRCRRRAPAAWRKLRARMQLVPQDPLGALDRRLRVRDAGRRAAADPRHRRRRRTGWRRLLDDVGLRPDQAARHPHALSGGQRQRAVLARALATSPELLVCDEPVSALDVSIQAQIVNLLMDLQSARNLAMVFISHDLRIVRQVSHEVAVMYLGRVIERGDPDAVFTDPAHPYSRALVGSIPGGGRARGAARRPARPGGPAGRLRLPPALPRGGRALPGGRAGVGTARGRGRRSRTPPPSVACPCGAPLPRRFAGTEACPSRLRGLA